MSKKTQDPNPVIAGPDSGEPKAPVYRKPRVVEHGELRPQLLFGSPPPPP